MDLTSSTNLVSFKDKWWWLFLSVLISSIVVHSIVTLMSFCSLHKHKQARWYSLCVLFMGLIMPVSGGILTSAVIAGVFQSLAWSMDQSIALILGASQTGIVVLVSFTRFLPSL